MRKLLSSIVITTLLLGGCAAKLPEEVVTHEFNDKNSYALNIAMQTNLMTDNSGLRDYEKGEIDEARKYVNKSKGNASKAIGALSILTGNLTGLIDIAGGVSADLALANKDKFHPAANPRWIIALNTDKYASGEDAYQSAVDEIMAATKSVMGKYGELKNTAHNDKYVTFVIAYNNKNYILGLSSYPESTLNTKTASLDGKTPKLLYLTGVENKYSEIGGYSLEAFEVMAANGKTQDDILKEITALLPEGFFYYRPAFETNTIPKSDFGKNVTYVNTNAVVPSIYAQGKRYDFLKPETK